MNKKNLKKISHMTIFALELIIIIFIVFSNKDCIIKIIPFLNEETNSNLDNIIIGIIGAFVYAIIEIPSQILVHVLFSLNLSPNVIISASGYNRSKLKDNIIKMSKFIFSTKCKWGVTQQSINKKNANTAEGLIACASMVSAGIELPYERKNEIIDIINDVISNLNKAGYQSYNVSSFTVHCTSMMLFAVKRFVDLGMYTITTKQEQEIHNCLNNLIDNANSHGWGFENKHYDDIDYNRTLSTIWALRALNSWGYSDRQFFRSILDKLIDVGTYKFGFSINTSEKKSITALFYILIYEIKHTELKDAIQNKIDFSSGIKYLLSKNCPDVEVEEFLTDKNTYNKLPWTHFCECLVIEAISLYHQNLTIIQNFKFAYIIKKCFNKLNNEHGYYCVQTMNFDHNDPFFYPTTYLMIATTTFLKNIVT